MQLSRIDQFFSNDQNQNIQQLDQLIYKIFHVKEENHTSSQNKIYIVTLSDDTYYINTYFHGLASQEMQLQEETKSINYDVGHTLIKIKKWELYKIQKLDHQIVIIYEFEIIEKDVETPQFQEYHQQQLKEYIIGQETKSKSKKQSKTQKSEAKESIMKKQIHQNKGNLSNYQESQLDYQQMKISDPSINFTQNPVIIQEIPNMNGKLKKWNLNGRIVFKSQLIKLNSKNYESEKKKKSDNSDSDDNYFKILIMDRNEDIFIGMFFDQCCQRFFDKLQIGKIYSFQNDIINDNKDEKKTIKFSKNSIITEQNEDIPLYPYINEQISIYLMQYLEQNTIVDLIGIVCNEIKQNDDNRDKRTIQVVDQTGQIYLTLWGAYQNQELSKGSIIALKSVKYQRGYLSSTNRTIILDSKELKLDKINELEQWSYNKDLDNVRWNLKEQGQEQNKIYTISQIYEFLEKQIERNYYYKSFPMFISGYLTLKQEYPRFYTSCSNSNCKYHKKIPKLENSYKCPSCYNKTENPRQTFRLSGSLKDDSHSINVTVFEEVGSKLLGMTGNEFHSLSSKQQNFILENFIEELEVQLTIEFKEKDGLFKPNVIIQQIYDIYYQKPTMMNLKYLEEIDLINEML